MQSLRSGNYQHAADEFFSIISSGYVDASLYLGLAYALYGQGNIEDALSAAGRSLELEPRNLRALLLKAAMLDASGDGRGAVAFYQTALKSAPPKEQIPDDLAEQLVHAKARCDEYGDKFSSFLEHRLAEQGYLGATSSGRFLKSLELLTGRAKLYLQEPRYYYFPELPTIQFFARDCFPWLDDVEAASQDIRAELLDVLQTPAVFTPYVADDPARPAKQQDGMRNNPDWSAFYLWKNGQKIETNAARCPRTLAALADAPLTRITHRSPSILFSLLRPGARIPPHCGMTNTRLICHLPLIVPPGCGFRVGNDTRAWEEGKAWVFDDTIEHEAWNNSREVRVILLFEIWRPELSKAERDAVNAMFAGIDAYTNERPTWEI